ncbi:uncharacterized protein EI90DRAFT_3069987 [Cantharellus anzutake]|uniref:uncharacterized protein n=1 Tax=Cantharellus anzutake TaxID=1750568 RepID=UPI001905F038|nr:uncharacterized protein EI90DRAFT_3069987 [Cantharellus anzutake]KAF8326630.1 hypothetical protein EI90DRAFT_3069987 [Cantharellus anzutake]
MMERLCLNPSAYGLSESSELKRPLRILELGAGTGLLSLAIGSLCIRANIPAHIIATDYHPDVLHNLRENLTANPCSVSDSVTINVEPLDWKLFSDRRDALDGGDGGSNPRSGDMTQTLDGLLSPIFSHPFDIIMASDVVYRPKHAEWLSCTVKSLLRRHDLPDIASDCDVTSRPPPPASFHLMAAIRPTHEHTRSSIEKAFNIHEESFKTNVDSPTLRIVSFQDIAIKAKPVGRADEIGYREYRIEWR